MNNVQQQPNLPFLSDAQNFLLRLLDVLRSHASAINDAADGRLANFATVAAGYTSGVNEHVILCDPAAPMALVLPDAQYMLQKTVTVKRKNNTTHTITITTPSASTFDGAASVTLTTAWQRRVFYCDGVAYYEIT